MKRTPMPPRKDYLNRLPKKRKPLRRQSKTVAAKLSMAEERYADACHVYFDEVPQLLGPVACWLPIRRLPSEAVRIEMEKLFVHCFWCGGRGCWHPKGTSLTLELHHIVGGSAGRSDERTNLFPCHRKCHQELQSDASLTGKVLWLKWRYDRIGTVWTRLAELHGRNLPDLITE